MGSSSKDAAAGRTRLDARDDTMVDVGDGDAPSLTRRAAVEDDDAWVATRRLIRGVAHALSARPASPRVTTREATGAGDAVAGPGPITALVAGSRRERGCCTCRGWLWRWTVGAVTAQKLVAGNNRNQRTERGRGVS